MSSKKWTYGDSWERFPIEPGQRWGVDGSVVAVHDIFEPLPEFMHTADLVFVDPPWNLGNINSFYTKAGRKDYVNDFAEFYTRLFSCIDEIKPGACYIEIGKQNVDVFQALLSERYPNINRWAVTYYKKNPCFIIRGGHTPYTGKDMTGMDEADCIKYIAESEDYKTIGDLCMGRGLVGYHAFKAGRKFCGTELNKRRLAVLLDNIAKAGGKVVQYA